MTDKQIMIDGCDVSGCDFLGVELTKKRMCACSMIDFCNEEPNCYYKQLKRKEQECEKLNKTITNLENIRDEFSTKLDQLKIENEELKVLNTRLDNQRETYWKEYKKLKQTLTEIRKIAQGVRNYLQVPHPKDVRYEMDIILQKISECEVEDE